DVAYCVHDVEDAVDGGWLPVGPRLDDAGDRADLVELTRSWYLPDAADDDILGALDRLRALPYWVHDYDGGRRSLAALKDMTSQLIGRFCQAAQQVTHEVHGRGRLSRYHADLEVPPEIRVEVAVMKGLAALYVMTNRNREPIYGRQRELIEELVAHLVRRGPDALEPMFAADWKDAPDDA